LIDGVWRRDRWSGTPINCIIGATQSGLTINLKQPRSPAFDFVKRYLETFCRELDGLLQMTSLEARGKAGRVRHFPLSGDKQMLEHPASPGVGEGGDKPESEELKPLFEDVLSVISTVS